MPRKNLIWSLAALLVIVLGPQATKAATINWTGTTGDWSDSTNWGGTLPTYSDDAYINGVTANVTQSGEICNNLYLDESGSGQSGTIEMTGGSLENYTSDYIGYSGKGTFTQSGGINSRHYLVGSPFYLGYNTGANGTYNLYGTGKLVQENEYIGYSGIGTFNQSGGTNSIWGDGPGNLYVGYNAGSSGTYKLSGTGSLGADSEYIGWSNNSSGVFQQSGGTNYITSYLSIFTTGQYTLSGGTVQISGGLSNMGIFDFDHGPGVLNASTNSLINLAMHGSSLLNTGSATLNVGAGSLLIVPSDFNTTTTFAHYSNSGMLHIAGTPLNIASGQTIKINGVGLIDDQVNCLGTLNGSIGLLNGLTISGNGNVNIAILEIYDGDSEMNGGTLSVLYQRIGYKGTGIFNQSSGTNTIQGGQGNLYVGYITGSTGIYNLKGSGHLNINTNGSEIIGYSGTGIFNQSSGTHAIAGTSGLKLGYNAGSDGTYNLTGGILCIYHLKRTWKCRFQLRRRYSPAFTIRFNYFHSHDIDRRRRQCEYQYPRFHLIYG